jgi:hypothetical protein
MSGSRKTYLAIIHGKGLKATGYIRDRYPGELRAEGRERVLGEFATAEEAYRVVWAHMKHVSAGLKAWKRRQGKLSAKPAV